MSITLGPRALGSTNPRFPQVDGKAEADKQTKQLTDQEGGGAIQLGSKLSTGDAKFKKRAEEQLAAAIARGDAPRPQAVVITTPVFEPVGDKIVPRATGNAVKKGKKGEKVETVPAPVTPAMSEEEVEVLLAEDPNAWDRVCEAETVRPEGWRPAVARMVVLAAPEAKDKPIPEQILDVLRTTVLADETAALATMKGATDAAAEFAKNNPPPTA